MDLHTALTSIDWLIESSGDAKELSAAFMGGEPLLQFELIKDVVPYGKRRAWNRGKSIQFSATTNLSLVTEEIVDFFAQWGMGWHASIDGTPEVQNYQRPFSNNMGSSRRVEQAVRHILKYRPTCQARSTMMEVMLPHLYESYMYFKKLGFVNVGIAPADVTNWTEDGFRVFRNQMRMVYDDVIECFRNRVKIYVSGVEYLFSYFSGETKTKDFTCGAGRGMVLVDPSGDLWPCHRWDSAAKDVNSERFWKMGNIFDGDFNNDLHLALLQRQRMFDQNVECKGCICEDYCSPGCPAGNLQEIGTIYRCHENWCEISRICYEEGKRAYDILYNENNEMLFERYKLNKRSSKRRNIYYKKNGNLNHG
jgi:uncharacterized protein